MGRPKLSLAFADGEALGAKALRALRASGAAAPLIAVVRPDDPLDWMTGEADAEVVRCAESALGISHSIRAGMRAARRHSPDAVLLALADMPFASPALFGRVAATFAASPQLDFAACDYGSFSSPPAVFSARMFDALESLRGDLGAHKLMTGSEYQGVQLPISEAIMGIDVDTPADWQSAIHESLGMFGNSV